MSFCFFRRKARHDYWEKDCPDSASDFVFCFAVHSGHSTRKAIILLRATLEEKKISLKLKIWLGKLTAKLWDGTIAFTLCIRSLWRNLSPRVSFPSTPGHGGPLDPSVLKKGGTWGGFLRKNMSVKAREGLTLVSLFAMKARGRRLRPLEGWGFWKEEELVSPPCCVEFWRDHLSGPRSVRGCFSRWRQWDNDSNRECLPLPHLQIPSSLGAFRNSKTLSIFEGLWNVVENCEHSLWWSQHGAKRRGPQQRLRGESLRESAAVASAEGNTEFPEQSWIVALSEPQHQLGTPTLDAAERSEHLRQ